MDKTKLFYVKVGCAVVSAVAGHFMYQYATRDTSEFIDGQMAEQEQTFQEIGDQWNQITQGAKLTDPDAKIEVTGGNEQIHNVLATGETPTLTSETSLAETPETKQENGVAPTPTPAPNNTAQPAAEIIENKDEEKTVAGNPEKAGEAEDEKKPEKKLTFHPPFQMDKAVNGRANRYRFIAPKGWSLADGLGDQAVFLNRQLRIVFTVSGGRQRTPEKNQDFADSQIARIKESFPGSKKKLQEVVTIASERWGRFDFSGAEDGTVILFTHSGEKGKFSIEVIGPPTLIKQQQPSILRIVKSFRFPPDNENPITKSGVRILE